MAAMSDPIGSAAAVDLSSTDATYTSFPSCLYVGVAGDVKVDMAGGATFGGTATGITFTAMPVGWHPIRVKKIYKVGTSADKLMVGWPATV